MIAFILFYSSCTDHSPKIEMDDYNQNTEMRSSGQLESEFCMLSGASCINLSFLNQSKTYVINGCSITVNYQLVLCSGKVRGIRNFSHTFANSSPCYNSKQAWNQYYLAGQTVQANQALNAFYRMLTLMVQADVVASLNPSDFPNGYVDLQWIETKCHTLCVKEVKSEDLPSYFDISHAVCGEGCCVRETKYKVVNGVFVQDGNPTLTSTDASCDPVPVQCVKDGVQWSNNCDVACERL